MRVWKRLLSLALCASMLLPAGCGRGDGAPAEEPEAEPAPPRVGDIVEKTTLTDPPLREDKSVYSDTSELYDVVTMYLTVREGNQEDHTDHTWTEVNSHDTFYYSNRKIDRYACEAILQVGDENGPVEGEFGYGETVPNATVCVRGQTSSSNSQKNYKVRIKDGKGTYKDMQTVPLNKYQTDFMRFRNKLVFDLMQPVPQMTAIRTQFVHLYVKDETEGGSGQFEDYGLYTRLEQMNKDYLENHGLDRKGYLYKLVMFEFYEYEELMKTESDPSFDKWTFEEILKPKGDTDHTKLQEMLHAVNDYMTPIETVVEKYFDVENFSYFLAYMILIGNTDIGARNEYLYSPLNSDKWYFLSWDCDASFQRTYKEMKNYLEPELGYSWEQGLTQFVGMVLFNRVFRVEKYRDAVTAAVEDLRQNYLTEEKINERIGVYRDIFLPYLRKSPDADNWSIDEAEFDLLCGSLAQEVETNYQTYFETLERPWPFYVAIPEELPDGRLHIEWDASYDMDGEAITYTCILSRNTSFTDVIGRAEGLRVPECYFDVQLAPGDYFIRVQATNESGWTQECFDYHTNDPILRSKRYGCFACTKMEDGTFVSILNE